MSNAERSSAYYQMRTNVSIASWVAVVIVTIVLGLTVSTINADRTTTEQRIACIKSGGDYSASSCINRG